MKSKRIYPAFTISKKGEMSLKNGHPWVYCDELRNEPEGLKNGELCDVFSEKGSYLGTGFLSLNSKIRIRILSDNANENFSENFFRRRIRYAIDYRKTVMGDDFSACRLIFGEADGMPGLTIDKYGDILVSQVLSYGMDMIKDMIFRLLVEELEKDGVKVSGIMERNDVAIRKLEGLEQYKGWYRAEFLPEPPPNITEITENGIRYEVDVENGQKTGFFLDQKYNRLAVSKIAKGKKVLDCFTHTGSFALNAAMGGAERGYKEINYRAMRLLPRGGYLATCSCSHFMENRLFVKMVMSAAKDAGVQLKLIEARQQAPDHPILLNVPETDYLKFYLFQVV